MISVDVFLCESWMIMLIKQILCAKNCLFLGTNRFMQGVFSLLTYIKYRYQPSFWYFHKSNLLVFAGTKTVLNRQYPPDIVGDTKGKNWFVSTSFRTLYLSLNQLAKKRPKVGKNERNAGKIYLQHIILLCSYLLYYMKVKINYLEDTHASEMHQKHV